MSKAENNFEKIRQYLEGELASNDHAAFEKEIAQNPNLQREVDAFKVANSAIEKMAEHRLKQELREFLEQTQLKKKKKRFRSIYVISVAAAALILLVLFTSGPRSPKEIYNNLQIREWMAQKGGEELSNYEIDSSYNSVLSIPNASYVPNLSYSEQLLKSREVYFSDTVDNALIFIEYCLKYYPDQNALPIERQAGFPSRLQFEYLRGCLYLYLKDFEKARIIFEYLERETAGEMKDRARFKIGLLHMALNEKEKALEVLRPLSEKPNIKREEAKELVQDLECKIFCY